MFYYRDLSRHIYNIISSYMSQIFYYLLFISMVHIARDITAHTLIFFPYIRQPLCDANRRHSMKTIIVTTAHMERQRTAKSASKAEAKGKDPPSAPRQERQSADSGFHFINRCLLVAGRHFGGQKLAANRPIKPRCCLNIKILIIAPLAMLSLRFLSAVQTARPANNASGKHRVLKAPPRRGPFQRRAAACSFVQPNPHRKFGLI